MHGKYALIKLVPIITIFHYQILNLFVNLRYHCECINMKAEDTPNYEHWYCAMCRAPRTARVKIDESVRRIETLAYEAKNLRINLPCISSSFIVEINAELKRMVSGDDLHS